MHACTICNWCRFCAIFVPFLCPPNRIAIAHTISMQPKAAHIAPGMSHAWRGVSHGTYVAASVVELGVLAT